MPPQISETHLNLLISALRFIGFDFDPFILNI